MGIWRFFKSKEDFIATFSVLIVLALLLIGVGWFFAQAWLMTFGGAILGSSGGALMGRLTARDIRDQITSSLEHGFSSKETKISGFMQKWYVYYCTKIPKQDKNPARLVWSLSIIDFTNSTSSKKLSTRTTLINELNKKVIYTVEAGVRGQHLIVFYNSKAGADCNAYVFPANLNDVSVPHYGIVYHSRWDDSYAISPAIMTLDPIGDENIGPISDELANKLDGQWRAKIEEIHTDILPKMT
jgi:hypothetical protein